MSKGIPTPPAPPLNAEDFRLPDGVTPSSPPRRKPKVRKMPGPYTDLYLGLPVRLGWLRALNALNKPTRALGFVLWHIASRKKSAEAFVASNVALVPLGILPDAKKRSLQKLEAAGLIKVEWRENKNPIVEILPEAGPRVTGDEDEG